MGSAIPGKKSLVYTKKATEQGRGKQVQKQCSSELTLVPLDGGLKPEN